MGKFSFAKGFACKQTAVAAGAALLLSASHTAAQAYLDPGTGSIILQGLIAGIVGTAAFARMYWTRLKTIFRRPSDHDEDEGGGNTQ